MPKLVTVVSKQGCHLCENVIKALRELAPKRDLDIRVLDISKDRELEDKYLLTIPVVQIGGKDVFDAGDISPKGDYLTMMERLLA